MVFLINASDVLSDFENEFSGVSTIFGKYCTLQSVLESLCGIKSLCYLDFFWSIQNFFIVENPMLDNAIIIF